MSLGRNRQSDRDRLAAEIDHEVNTKAELEIGLLLQRLDDIERDLVDLLVSGMGIGSNDSGTLP